MRVAWHGAHGHINLMLITSPSRQAVMTIHDDVIVGRFLDNSTKKPRLVPAIRPERLAQRSTAKALGIDRASVERSKRPLERVALVLNHLFGVMAGLVPAIHVFLAASQRGKAWMAGTSPAMTAWRSGST